MHPLFVDPDIRKAQTLPTSFYLDQSYFDQAKEKIFARCWQFAGDTDRVKEPGWVTPVNLLEDYLDEPIILSRDKQNIIHCLTNVCTHRGNLIVEKPCKLNEIRCKYHGRRFHLDGSFLSMPEFKEVENFPTSDDNLTSLPLFQWGKLLFTRINEGKEAVAFFKEISERMSWMPLDELVFRPDLSRDYYVNANWALYCENYLEGFHIPFVHAGLNAVIDYKNYEVELFPYSCLQVGIAKNEEMVFDIPASSPDHGRNIAAYYFWVFPNMMFNFYPWGLSVNIVDPLGIDRTKVSMMSYVWDENKLRQGAGSDLHKVELEDEEIVQNVQKGIRSRFYKYGRYSVTRETGTHHFHRMICDFMNG